MKVVKEGYIVKLPIKTTQLDITRITEYLANKPTGATLQEAKGVLDTKVLDGRKISALKTWNIIEEEGQKLKLTAKGRDYARGSSAEREVVLRNVIEGIAPYKAAVEKAFSGKQDFVISTDVGANWNDHFKEFVGESDTTIQAQAVCFFHIAAGANLGVTTIGRRGKPTRFDWNLSEVKAFVSGQQQVTPRLEEKDVSDEGEDETISSENEEESNTASGPSTVKLGQSIFLAHGKDKKALDQVKTILGQFNIPFKLAVEEPNLGRPISSKVRETMHACNCAILLFTADEQFTDAEGNTVWRPSENVVHELGACSYLYEDRVVIIKDKKVEFPSNFKDLGYITFSDDNLNEKAMDIVKELIGFGILKIST